MELKEKIKKLEETLKKETFYLKEFELPEGMDYKSFLKTFFNLYNNKHITLASEDKVYCYPGKNRSLGDIYKICLHYFPNISLEEVMKELAYLVKDELTTVGVIYCPHINKRVFISNSKVWGVNIKKFSHSEQERFSCRYVTYPENGDEFAIKGEDYEKLTEE